MECPKCHGTGDANWQGGGETGEFIRFACKLCTGTGQIQIGEQLEAQYHKEHPVIQLATCRYCGTRYSSDVCSFCGHPPSNIQGEPIYTASHGRQYIIALPCKHCGATAPILSRRKRPNVLLYVILGFLSFGLFWLLMFTATQGIYCAACGGKV